MVWASSWKVDESSPREDSGLNMIHYVRAEICGEGFRSPQGSPPGERRRPAEEGRRPASYRGGKEKCFLNLDAVPRHEVVGDVVDEVAG